MHVLIADDDASTLYIASRILTQTFHCQVLVAHNGLEVLEVLQREQVDVLVLDVQMPLLDGLDTLRILRDSTQWADLPVVVLSATKEEGLVRELIGLGVTDFVVKPLGDRFVERFESLVATLGGGGNHGSASARRRSTGADLSAASTVLIADGDSDYRQFFRKNIGTRFKTLEAESGVKALEICLKNPPDAVFLGTDLGVMSREHIVRQLRATNRRPIHIIAVPLKSEAADVRASGTFDEVFVRTYVPGAFKKELGRLVQGSTVFGNLTELFPDLRTRLIRSVEQVFGMMLSADVEPAGAPQPMAEEQGVWASMPLTIPGFVITIRLQYGITVGRAVAAAFLETDAGDMGADDVAAVASEVINVLTGRVQAGFQERKLEPMVGLPQSGSGSNAPGAPMLPDLDLEIMFSAVEQPVVFQVGLGVVAAAPVAQPMAVDTDSGALVLRSDA